VGERRDSEARVTDKVRGATEGLTPAPVDLVLVHPIILSDGSRKVVSTGRQYRPDVKDRDFELTETKLRGIKAMQVKKRSRPWGIGPILDQGETNECTIFTFAQFLQSAPYIHTLLWSAAAFTERYRRAQAHDGITRPHEGTTERAVLSDAKADGLITEYLHVTDEDIAKEYLLTRGTLCFGSDWFPSMFTPDEHGYVEPDHAPTDLGHEYLMRWYYAPRHARYPDTYEFANSWGPKWGDEGMFRMKADAVRYLWQQLNGDLMSPVEAARKATHKLIQPVVA
jgi:hypothetical protein